MDSVEMCADAAAAWHASWLTALGLRSERRDSVWRALDRPPVIYWNAITLRADAKASSLVDVHGALCDSWSALDLERLEFRERGREPWFVRPAGELPAEEAPPELELLRVSTPAEVEEFELVSMRGFGDEHVEPDPGWIHPPSILADSRMTMLTGRVAGRPVAASMGYRTDAAIGIFGVTTVASARGRGYATAVTRAAIDPALPAILSPSPEAESLYRRLGFEQVGELRQWERR